MKKNSYPLLFLEFISYLQYTISSELKACNLIISKGDLF